jgi:capsular exopolysaccharide synthesis family protein
VNSHQQLPPAAQSASLAQYQAGGLQPFVPVEQAEDEFDAGIDLSDILQVLWARKWWILLAALIGLALALGYSLLQTPMYRATASLELNPPTVPILASGETGGEELVAPQMDRQFQETQIGIMRSRALAERVVQDLNLAAEAGRNGSAGRGPGDTSALAASLALGLTVLPTADSRIVELSYASDDPQEAARIANAFAKSFVQLTLDRKYEATTSARRFLEDRIKTVREDVNDAERRLVAYAKASGIVLIPGGEGEGAGTSTLTGESLGALNAALAVAQQKRIAAEQRYRQAGALTQGGAGVAGLRQEKAQLEAEYREKSTFLQDSFPEMARLKARIAELDSQIRGENSRAAETLGGEYRAALAEEQALKARVSQLSGNALSEREDSVQYNILQRELDTSRSLYQALLERYNEVGVVEGIGTAQAALVDTAQVPSVPYEPSVLRNSLLGVLLGLFLGGALAVLYDRLTNTIKTKDDIREKLGLPALGAIPMAPKNVEFLDEVRDPKSHIYDAYAGLRTALQLASTDGFPKTMVVTSSRPEEGKSSTSYSLCVQLADIGKRVLLIDGDMRKPSFIIGEESKAGLSSLLTSDTPLGNHIAATTSKNLWLMGSGPVPPNPANIILPARLEKILADVGAWFDHIIIDAPPSAGFPDAILLGSCADAVLFTIESGKTRTATARAVITQLRMAGVKVLGAVLTKASERSVDYGYAYGYYYGSSNRDASSAISIAELGPADFGSEKED